MSSGLFEEEYKKLNKEQKEAVDSIDGPVMVVAGPGTGKTQILALRIGNILKRTDTSPDGILCLTFTNSGVSAMRERLRRYIGASSTKIKISTFHSFAISLVEEYFHILNLPSVPKFMEDADAISLCDRILNENEWDYIRPRGDAGRYFKDLKSLISLFKRERMTPEEFASDLESEIIKIKKDPESISSRGPSKGEMKKDIARKIEGLERSREVVLFYQLYEKKKQEENCIDYDDALELAVRIVEESDDAKKDIQEKYLYVLVDEHQDSSGIQNEFLKKVWGDVEQPNIFVVGDDRQLIYGFGGASLSYFEGFKHDFGKAKLITLLDNYRSTKIILEVAHSLLESVMTKGKLVSHSREEHPLRLVECDYPRDEIIACALEIKEKIASGIKIEECALLVPKNKQVRSAIEILKDQGISVSSERGESLFENEDFQSLFRVVKYVANPVNESFENTLFDPISGVKPIEAHKFLFEAKKLNSLNQQSLFESDSISCWKGKLDSWIERIKMLDAYKSIQLIGNELLLKNVKNHEELLSRVAVLRTILSISESERDKRGNFTLPEFISIIERFISYDTDIPLQVFESGKGLRVLTLHSSKGLEFDYVWIAHMDERSLTSGKKQNFTLPEKAKEKVEKKDEDAIKRQLYVAITRTKRFCNISYSRYSHSGANLELAHVISDLPQELFEKTKAEEVENKILSIDPKIYVENAEKPEEKYGTKELAEAVSGIYEKRKISVSLLNNFFECPWKWYFRNLLELPEPQSESLEFGNIIHSSIDKILKLEGKISVEDIVSKEVQRRNLSGDKIILKTALRVVEKWVKNRLPEIEKDRENEKSISTKDERFPHLHIYGKIDLIERIGQGTYRVTDFKTGNPKKKIDIERENEEGRMSNYLRQLAMYSYLLNLSRKDKVVESKLEFLEAPSSETAFYQTIIGAEEINKLIKDIQDYDQALKEGSWIGRECFYNDYGKGTVCEYCERSKIYLKK